MMSNSLFPLRLSITLIFQVQGTEGGCAMELLDVTRGNCPLLWMCGEAVIAMSWTIFGSLIRSTQASLEFRDSDE